MMLRMIGSLMVALAAPTLFVAGGAWAGARLAFYLVETLKPALAVAELGGIVGLLGGGMVGLAIYAAVFSLLFPENDDP
jgi:hypothetical protein